VNVTLEEDLPGQAAVTGDYLMAELRKLQRHYSEHLMEVRGLGLLIGLEFVDTEFGYAVAAASSSAACSWRNAAQRQDAAHRAALNIPRTLVDELLDKLDQTLRELTT